MAKKISEILDSIQEIVENGGNVPFSGGKKSVDADQILDYLDEIREALPGELRQSQVIVNERTDIIDKANEQASAIIKKAEERAKVLVSETEIVRAAEQAAGEIVAEAQKKSNTLCTTAESYCGDMLKKAEEELTACVQHTRSIRSALAAHGQKSEK